MARDLTGIDVPSLFPYEDNRGLFETMDGHQLMDWLTAVYFQAVDWEPIPGSAYGSAALREVDTSTPEYLAFEKQLYGKVLERMGFDAVLAPEPEVSRTTELKQYSPLQIDIIDRDSRPPLSTASGGLRTQKEWLKSGNGGDDRTLCVPTAMVWQCVSGVGIGQLAEKVIKLYTREPSKIIKAEEMFRNS